MENPFGQVIVAVAAALGGTGAWQFYQNRMRIKSREKKEEIADQNLFRDDLRERVAILAQKLELAQLEKEKTAKELAIVMSQMSEYKVRIEFLEKENERLKALR